jgi:hypothetical protein
MPTASRVLRAGLPALLSVVLVASFPGVTPAASAPAASAEAATSNRGAVELTIVDAATGEGVPWAQVTLPAGASRLADEHGRCRLEDLPPGPLRLRVSQVSYHPREELVVQVDASRTAREIVSLEPAVRQLAPVVVRGDPGRTPREGTRGRETVLTERVAALPNPTDDLFQIVRVLPGVAAEDVGGVFHLRGGGPEETLVRLDGMDVRSMFHGRDVGGLTGIVPLELVDRVDVYPGAFPAELGGRLSGALDVHLRDGGAPGVHGRLAADVTAARGAVERHGERSSWFLAAREGYLHRILDSLQDDVVVQPAYRDLLVRSVLRPDPSQAYAANYLRVEDHVVYEDGIDAHAVSAGYVDHYLWGTVRWDPSSRFRLGGVVDGAFSRQRRRVETDGRDDRDGWRAGGRLEARLAQGAHVWKAGVETEREWGDYAFRGRDVVRIDAQGRVQEVEALDVSGSLAARRSAAYLQDEWAPWKSLALAVGLRASHDTGTDEVFLSPRVAAAIDLPARWLLRGAWGSHVQPPRVGLTGESELLVSSERAQRALHSVVGVEKAIGRLQLGVDVWEKRFRPLDGVVSRTVDGVVERHVIMDGRSRGFEASVRREGRRSTGWFAYSLDRSDWSDGDRVYSRDFDALHTLALANTFRIGPDWDVGVSYRFRTGTPYTEQKWRREGDAWTLNEDQPNAARLPDYHRVDLRVTRRFRFDGWEMSVWGEALNLTNHDNVLWYAWRLRRPDGSVRDDPERVARTGVPGIPSLGIEARF